MNTLGCWQSSTYTLYIKTPREILCGVAKELEATQESHQVLSSVVKGSTATDQRRSQVTSRGVAMAVEKLRRYRIYTERIRFSYIRMYGININVEKSSCV